MSAHEPIPEHAEPPGESKLTWTKKDRVRNQVRLECVTCWVLSIAYQVFVRTIQDDPWTDDDLSSFSIAFGFFSIIFGSLYFLSSRLQQTDSFVSISPEALLFRVASWETIRLPWNEVATVRPGKTWGSCALVTQRWQIAIGTMFKSKKEVIEFTRLAEQRIEAAGEPRPPASPENCIYCDQVREKSGETRCTCGFTDGPETRVWRTFGPARRREDSLLRRFPQLPTIFWMSSLSPFTSTTSTEMLKIVAIFTLGIPVTIFLFSIWPRLREKRASSRFAAVTPEGVWIRRNPSERLRLEWSQIEGSEGGTYDRTRRLRLREGESIRIPHVFLSPLEAQQFDRSVREGIGDGTTEDR